MTRRRQLLDLVGPEPRTISSLARELGLTRREIEDDLPHLLRSARAAGREIEVIPARCRKCGFTFDRGSLAKPGKCPACRGTWIHEPMLRASDADKSEG